MVLSLSELTEMKRALVVELRAIGLVLREMREKNGGVKLNVSRKVDQTLVSDADKMAEERLCVLADKLAPGVSIVSEEDGKDKEPAGVSENLCWVIDPLDGTAGFLAGRDEFTINVALLYKRRPILGILHAPMMDESLVGWRGKEQQRKATGVSFFQGDSGETEIKARTESSDKKVRVVCSRSRGRKECNNLQRVWQDVVFVKQDAATKFMTLIKGEADIYLQFRPTKLWDTVSAQIMIENLGGGFWCIDGLPYKIGNYLDDNPAIFAMVSKKERCRLLLKLQDSAAC